MPQTFEIGLFDRPVSELHSHLRRMGLFFSNNYWLGPGFHEKLREGVAVFTFADPKRGMAAKLSWPPTA